MSAPDAGVASVAAPPAVLVVDDDARMLASVRDLLALRGYRVETADNGEAAIERLTHNGIDLALLDVRLGAVDGLDVLDHVRRQGSAPPVIMLSGDASIDTAIRALRRGAYDFVRKPYAPEELLRTVDNALRKHGLERENAQLAAQLDRSERLHRYMVDHSPDLIFIVAADGHIVFVNPSARLLGYEPAQLLGQHYLSLVHAADRELARTLFADSPEAAAGRAVELRLRDRDAARDAHHFELHARALALDEAGNGVQGMYCVARDITERKRAEETIAFQAYHDPLTGLANRLMLREQLATALNQARLRQSRLALMFLDLNRFKYVNDTLGHAVGDELLRRVANRLRECLRGGDLLARIGGDEFVLLLPDIRASQDAAVVAGKIHDALAQAFVIDGQELYIGTSIGVAFHPGDGNSVEALIKAADIAMYHCKSRHSGGGCDFYSAEMDAGFSGRFSLETAIRKGIDAHQFEVHYQPQVDGQSGEVDGVEALVRWNHPSRGLLLPAEFVQVAEDTGQIVPLGRLVLEQALRTFADWRTRGIAPGRLAVNISSQQIEQADFVPEIAGLLKQTGVPATMLELELTEHTVMRDVDRTVARLRALCELGVRVAIDDFGTGYSSLSYLERLPLDTIKIDREFVRNVCADKPDSPIVVAIVAMARGLGRKVVAEGVESETQRHYLDALGCRSMQGFLFSRPLASAAMERFLGEHLGAVL